MMLTPNPNPSHDVNPNPSHGVKSDPALTQTRIFPDYNQVVSVSKPNKSISTALRR